MASRARDSEVAALATDPLRRSRHSRHQQWRIRPIMYSICSATGANATLLLTIGVSKQHMPWSIEA